MIVRSENQGDIEVIGKRNIAAFGTGEKANIVDAAKVSALPCTSLVCEEEGSLAGDTSGIRIMAVAPLVVVPPMQNKVIGRLLVKTGIAL